MRRADCLLLLAFGFANAVLYSSLLPLWDGFDEPWHYGYVQYLDTRHSLPVSQKTYLCDDLWQSMLKSPASYLVQRLIVPEVPTFESYFKLSPSARTFQRSALEAIPRSGCVPSIKLNYEAQQAPLAYALLAGPDLLLSHTPIPIRIFWLRILVASIALSVTFFAVSLLFRTLELSPAYRVLGIFCVFACQMYWGTVAHVANDGFSLPLTVWFFATVAAFSKQPDRSGAMRLALVVSLGLLTKAYFLPLSVFAATLVAWRCRFALPRFVAVVAILGGPWYVRNLIVYHNLTGLNMAAGITPGEAIAALTSVDWSRAIPYMLRATLWTGNNSFTSFSSNTLNLLLGLLLAGVAMYAVQALRHSSIPIGEWTVLGAVTVFAAAVAYVVGNDVVFQHGRSAGAAPWYTIVLLVPTLSIVLLGMNRTRRLGPLCAIVTGLLWAYICIATYLVKLIPLYGGYEKGRNTLKETAAWYLSSHRELTSMLSTISLAPPAMIYIETGLVIALAITLMGRIAFLINGFQKLSR